MKKAQKILIKRASVFGITGLIGMLLFLYIQSGGNRFGHTLFFMIFYYLIPSVVVSIVLSLLIQRNEIVRKIFASRLNLVLSIIILISVFIYPWGIQLAHDLIFHLITLMFLWFALSLVFAKKPIVENVA